ncbi:MAG: aspartate/glutamate racemase family protein [Granulosicoccus sp.]
MKIAIINPNSTESMTSKVLEVAHLVAPMGAFLKGITSIEGPPAIQGPEDGLAAVPGLLKEIKNADNDGIDGFIIACFDDTGIDEARQLTTKPVIGIGEAAFHASMMLGYKFSVVTTLSVSVPVIEENIERYGVYSFCKNVRASEVPVLELEREGSNAEHRISAEIETAIKEDNCSSIVLGCAGMADLPTRLSKRHKIPVIDGVAAAVGMVCALVAMQKINKL